MTTDSRLVIIMGMSDAGDMNVSHPHTETCCTPHTDRSEGDPRTSHHTLRAPAAQNSEAATNGRQMVLLGGGAFLMGTDEQDGFPADGEGPVRSVELSPFYIDREGVTNERFKQFVEKTGYRTESERFGWSFVFQNQVTKRLKKKGLVRAVPGLEWWLGVDGAYWEAPEGPGSSIAERMDHPVTHVSWNDANAYCQWTGARLPSEAEWEFAARGGLVQKKFAWGDELRPGGEHRCNIWQGSFPESNSVDDGWETTCPTRSYRPNGYGLYTISGNVWEWCSDWFHPTFHAQEGRKDPSGPPSGNARVMRGGSFLCHKSYCNRYRVAARSSNTPDSATTNLGFRCAKSA